jgi:septal ring factor EnvC (AmiA/AmiB activator)
MSTMQDWAAILVGLGLGGVLVEGIRFVLHRKGMDADAAKTVTEAAVGLVAPLKERINELETDLGKTEEHASDLDRDLKEATATVVKLMTQIEALNDELTACRAELRAMRHDMGPHSPT